MPEKPSFANRELQRISEADFNEEERFIEICESVHRQFRNGAQVVYEGANCYTILPFRCALTKPFAKLSTNPPQGILHEASL
jgi:hypothetical protein